MSDQYTHWHKNLAGEITEFHDTPEPGFYSFQGKDGERLPASIWLNAGGKLQAKIGNDSKDPHAIWTYVCRYPIKYELFTAVSHGARWPDETPGIDMTPEAIKDKRKAKEPGMGHNEPPEDEFARLEYDIADVERAIGEALKETLATKADGDRVANLRDKANDLSKKANELRKKEKKPHDDAGTAVQKKWLPLVQAAKFAADKVRKPLLKLIEVLEDAKTAALKTADPEMSEQEVAEAAKTRVGGRMGKRTGLKKQKVAEIIDYDRLIVAIKDYAEIRELAQTIANKVIRAGGELPGVKMKEVKSAV